MSLDPATRVTALTLPQAKDYAKFKDEDHICLNTKIRTTLGDSIFYNKILYYGLRATSDQLSNNQVLELESTLEQLCIKFKDPQKKEYRPLTDVNCPAELTSLIFSYLDHETHIIFQNLCRNLYLCGRKPGSNYHFGTMFERCIKMVELSKWSMYKIFSNLEV